MRRICTAHLRHHCRYDSRLSLSEYFPYLIPRLYGGDVTVMSMQLFGSSAIPATQSPRRRSCAKKANSSCAIGSLIRTIRMIRTKATICTEKFTAWHFEAGERENNAQRALSTQIQRPLECLFQHHLITTGLVSFDIPLNSENLSPRKRDRPCIWVNSLSETEYEVREAAPVSMLRRQTPKNISFDPIKS